MREVESAVLPRHQMGRGTRNMSRMTVTAPGFQTGASTTQSSNVTITRTYSVLLVFPLTQRQITTLIDLWSRSNLSDG